MKQKDIFVCIAAILVLIWSLFPIYLTLIASISPERDILEYGFALVPRHLSFANYFWLLQLFSGGNLSAVAQAFLNTFFLSIVSSAIGTTASIMAGYAFGRLKFRLKNTILFLFISSWMIPSIALVIPYFTLFARTGLIGTHLGVLLTYLALVLPLATWILSGYFASLPADVERAARLDGCTRLQAIRFVVLPMARGGIVAVWLISVIFTWNELLFSVLIGANTVKLVQPLILQLSGFGYSATGNSIVIGSLIFPTALALVFQKYIRRLNIIQPE